MSRLFKIAYICAIILLYWVIKIIGVIGAMGVIGWEGKGKGVLLLFKGKASTSEAGKIGRFTLNEPNSR